MEQLLQPLVSIVTPFYNTAEYLEECIESVLAQSYDNWEYILVNNCSTDNSLEIAQKYAGQEPKIRIINNNTFLSQVQNYNNALKQISPHSKYCKIVQADDWIFQECVEKMVEIAEQNSRVGIVGAYRIAYGKIEPVKLPILSTVISGRDICRFHLFLHGFAFGTPNSLLIRSDIVRNRVPFYNESSLHEDTELCYELLQKYDFGFVQQVLTYTRTDNVSITSKVMDFGPDYLDNLIILSKYGRVFLDNQEYKKCYKRALSGYYRLLAKGIIFTKGRDFRKYHNRGLQTIGFKLSWLKMLLTIILVLMDYILNPKRTFEILIRKLMKENND